MDFKISSELIVSYQAQHKKNNFKSKMFKNSVLLIAVVALCGIAYADVTAPGACPTDINVMPNYDPTKYVGVWYEYSKYPYVYEKDGKCNTATYTLESDGSVRVNNSMINEETEQYEDIIGNGVLVDNAKLKVAIQVTPTFTASSNYWILDTDYTTYSCVYSCQPFPPPMHTTFLWILTRERIPDAEAIQKCNDVFVRNNLSLDFLKQTTQENC